MWDSAAVSGASLVPEIVRCRGFLAFGFRAQRPHHCTKLLDSFHSCRQPIVSTKMAKDFRSTCCGTNSVK